MLATGEQLTPAIEPDKIAAIDIAIMFSLIPATTVEIIGINIPNAAHDDPTAKDNAVEIKNDANGIIVSDKLK